jgi:hypothetical protein
MEDSFAPPRDNDGHSQQSRRSATRSGDGYYIESESPSSRCDSRDDGRGKNPYEGEDEQYCVCVCVLVIGYEGGNC